MAASSERRRGAGAGVGRGLGARLKSAKGRSESSKRWLERQLRDPYVAAAKRLGYRSRAAFKLEEIDDRHRFLRPGATVVDLGAAPGSWSQVAAERVRAAAGQGRVVAIDIEDMKPIPGVVFLRRDFCGAGTAEALAAALGGRPADAVISDLAPHATGHRQTDHLRVMALAEAALDFARLVLRPGGTFLAKVLRGGTEGRLLAELKRDFAAVRHLKPKASRPDSAELYVLASGFRGRARELDAGWPGFTAVGIEH